MSGLNRPSTLLSVGLASFSSTDTEFSPERQGLMKEKRWAAGAAGNYFSGRDLWQISDYVSVTGLRDVSVKLLSLRG